MSISQKFISFISGFLMIVFGILMLTLEEDGYEAVLLILETALMLSGIQQPAAVLLFHHGQEYGRRNLYIL